MSQLIFPALQGLTWNYSKKAIWKYTVQTATSGKEGRIGYWTYPRYEITVKHEFLTNKSYSGSLVTEDKETLESFFNSVGGVLEDFLYYDSVDNVVTDQTFGVGDGVTTAYQLVRNIKTWKEPIYSVLGSPTVEVDGNTITNYTISDFGLLTFTTAPANGTILSWSGNFYFRVRFLEDTQQYDQFLYNLYSENQVNLITVKI
jgi:uncharacterized protein (TIGR02217 family)